MRKLLAVAAMAFTVGISPLVAQQYVAGGFPATEIDLAQVPAAASGNPVRKVIADKLPLYTRPIPEAAILDRLELGVRVPLVTEGAGWATMDLGGGFLGWMRIEGLGPDTAPKPAVAKASVPATPVPFPVPRPEGLGAPVSPPTVIDVTVTKAEAPRQRRF